MHFTAENTQGAPLRMLPSMATAVLARLPCELLATGVSSPPALCTVSHSFSLDGELPRLGSVTSAATVRAIYDQGSFGVVLVGTEALLPGTGTTLLRTETTLRGRGQGGSDPGLAKKAGFDRPILHGLCSYGFVARALLDHCWASDPSRYRGLGALFASPVYPGEALPAEIVQIGCGRAARRVMVDAHVVLDGGTCSYVRRC
jgi:MaoC like domain